MNDILSHYELFGAVVIWVSVLGFMVYRFLSNREESELDKISATHYKSKAKNPADKLVDYDKNLFQKFVNLLPSTAGSIYFLKTHDMTMVFHERELESLYEFYDDWNGRGYRFKNKDLETLKDKLYNSVEQYVLTFSVNSEETSNGYYKAHLNIDALHVLSDEIIRHHDSFSTLTRAKLYA